MSTDSLTIRALRRLFDSGSAKTSKNLAPYVPRNVQSFIDVVYDESDIDGRVDIFVPDQPQGSVPVIAWLHGGGWFTGRKSDVRNYLKVVAAKGLVTVGIEYTPAPTARYPTPLKQTLAALAFLDNVGKRYNADTTRIFLGGDSSGAQIAAQTALVVTNPAYAATLGIASPITAEQLCGMILYCGAYDLSLIDGDKRFTWLTRKILSNYFGRKEFENIENYGLASVAANVTATFPPTFISAGNGDPLAPFSYLFANQLKNLGVFVDEQFFEARTRPRVPHEYQFNLSQPPGRESLERMTQFVRDHPR